MIDESTPQDQRGENRAAGGGDEADDADSRQRPRKDEAGARGGQSFLGRFLKGLRSGAGNSLREDLAHALSNDTGVNTAFSPEERAMLHNILRLREVRVEDVMVPRADIDAIDQTTSIADLMLLFEESGRSRMPVYHENLDDPRGMIHIRDLLAHLTKQARSKRRVARRPAGALDVAQGEAGKSNDNGNGNGAATRKHGPFDFSRVDFSKSVQEAGIVRDVLFVPPSMLASDLMERMQAMRTQMALVIDEYGGTDGLVSLEDIVEMVVGDIEDEHDDDETMITKSSEDVFLADAKADLEDLHEIIGPDFDVREQLEDVDTLGGLLFAALGRIPARGEVVQALPGFEFHVLDADPRRIKRVRIVRRRAPARRRPAKLESDVARPVDPAVNPTGETD